MADPFGLHLSNKRILIIDAEYSSLSILKSYLEKDKYLVSFAKNGTEGLHISQIDPPDLILVHANLPDMGCFELCDRLHNSKLLNNTPIIIILKINQFSLIDQCYASGGIDIIIEPVQSAPLLKKIRCYLRLNELNNFQNKISNLLTRKNKNGEALDLNGQLMQIEKFTYLEELIDEFSHEINTPVGLGITAVSHLKTRYTAFSKLYETDEMERKDLDHFLEICKECLWIIQPNLDRSANLVSNFKSFANGQFVKTKDYFNLKDELETILLCLKPKLKKTRHYVELVCDPEIMIYGNRGLLFQIISNLVINSLCHAFKQSIQGNISLKVNSNDQNIDIFYSDNGEGMEESIREKIFEKYFTTKEGRGGTGLGLHIALTIIEQDFHGNVTCTSTKGKGTHFKISLPMTPPTT